MESSKSHKELNSLEVSCLSDSNDTNFKEVDHEINVATSESNNRSSVSEQIENTNLDLSDVRSKVDAMNKLTKNVPDQNHINDDVESKDENVISNDSNQSSDSSFTNGSLEKMSIIDEETKEALQVSKKLDESLDSDDDSEPIEKEVKEDVDQESIVLPISDRACDMVVDNDEDSGGGGTTSYETAGSSTGSQCDKPSPFKGTKVVQNCSKHESSSSDINVSNGSRGRKRINNRSRLSSSSSGSTETSSSSASSTSSLDSDDDSKTSLNSSGPSAPSESWRKKNFSSQLRKANKAMNKKVSSKSGDGLEGITSNQQVDESSQNKTGDVDNTDPHEGNSSPSVAQGRKKKKKKSKKRAKLEKRKKPSVSRSSNSSEAFVSLEDIPGSSEPQDPGFRVLNSSMKDNANNETGEAQTRDSNEEHLSDNDQSDSDDSIPNETGRQRHRSNSSSSSSSSNSDAILRQARFGPRNRMMRARIRAQEEAARENESESDRPPPEVLSKPSATCKYSLIKDFIKRQYDSKPTHPWFIKNRIGSLDLIKRFELSQKLEGHDGCVNALHFNESGSRLASGSDDKEIIVWDWEKGKKLVSFPTGHHSNVFQSKFLPLTGDTHLVSTSRDGQVRLAVLSTTGVCRSTKRLAQHKGPANKLALLPQCPHTFISCGEDGILYNVDVREPKPTKLLVQKDPAPISGGGNGANNIGTGKTIPIYTVNANPLNDNMIATAGRDPHVRVYDRRKASEENNQPLKKFCPHHLMNSDTRASITCAVWNYNGTEILASYNDDDIYLFDSSHSDGADYIKRFQGHRNSATVKGVNFYGGKSEFIVSGSDCGNIFFWDKETESITHMMSGDVHGVVNVLEPHPSLPVLATSGLDDDVKIWMPTSNKDTSKDDIEKAVLKNAKDRRENSLLEPDFFDSQMLWAMLRHLRRDRRRRERAAERDGEDADPREETDSVSEDDEDDQGDSQGDSDSDDDGGMPQCQQS